MNIFSNPRFLNNIRECNDKQGLRIHTNGGPQDTHMVGDLPGFGTVWYNPASIANILSLAAVRKICRITMDTEHEPAIIVHKRNGGTMKFTESDTGLYYYDAKANNTPVANYTLLHSVEENKKIYTRRQLEQAELARRLYELVGRPSHKDFLTMIRENQLKHCPISVEDANRSVQIYGPDVHAIRGKTTRPTPTHVLADQLRPLPIDILNAHQNVTLCTDVFVVDGLNFLVTVSRNLHYLTVEHIPLFTSFGRSSPASLELTTSTAHAASQYTKYTPTNGSNHSSNPSKPCAASSLTSVLRMNMSRRSNVPSAQSRSATAQPLAVSLSSSTPSY